MWVHPCQFVDVPGPDLSFSHFGYRRIAGHRGHPQTNLDIIHTWTRTQANLPECHP
jgi:hypothetical protein